MNKAFSIIAIILSVVAISLSLWTFIDREHIARQALNDREAALIRHYQPNLQKIAADFDITNYPSDPHTLEEAFDPILKAFEGLSKP
ncbi:MAG TPA: hypothetical protein VG711_12815 [Phycisphaerales bacterium]|nr:hypothetical protein [Phycisphaerales bacterium]